ncbi:MAG TPA: DEAD/DEAH box helicase, partial [Bacteroidetes bacterium]|nr:DEAD/DEAH box helicase [Bacteroidota bacterium]
MDNFGAAIIQRQAVTAPILRFHDGTLVLENWDRESNPPYFHWDPRSRTWRALAFIYADVLKTFRKKKIHLQDTAQAFNRLDLRMKLSYTLFPHQKEALKSWLKSDCRGTVVLPTGSGKSLVALYAMASLKISTLLVSPTLDLMNQWYARMGDAFGVEIGILGGGYHEIRPLTVTTYDSAYRHMDRYGDRFGFLIFDEIHHLPAPAYSQIPELSLAPYRLGLTATYRRSDAQHLKLT